MAERGMESRQEQGRQDLRHGKHHFCFYLGHTYASLIGTRLCTFMQRIAHFSDLAVLQESHANVASTSRAGCTPAGASRCSPA